MTAVAIVLVALNIAHDTVDWGYTIPVLLLVAGVRLAAAAHSVEQPTDLILEQRDGRVLLALVAWCAPLAVALLGYSVVAAPCHHAGKVGERNKAALTLMYRGGLTTKDTTELLASDVDLDAETLTVARGRQSERTISLDPDAFAVLRTWASPYSGPRDFVFASRDGSGYDHRNIGGRVLSRAVKGAELQAIKDRDGQVVVTAPTFHSLRHSHASALIAAGWDLQEVSDRLGHSDASVTMTEYLHEFDSARRSGDRRNRLAALYGVEASMEAFMEAEGVNRPQQAQEANPRKPALLHAIGTNGSRPQTA